VAPDALIFDLDGPLWDSNATCALAWNRVLVRLGVPYRPIEAADVRGVAGKPHLDAVRAVFHDLDDALVRRISAETEREDVLAIAEHGAEIYPGVRELVPRLRERVPLMIVSNCQSGYIEVFLRWTGLAAHFVDFECWGNTGASKASNVRAVIDRNGLRTPLFVGDTEGDREAARENGLRFVHASYGFGEVHDADHRLARFADVVALVPGATETVEDGA
jgi:phosphoglycolate phosphatase